MAGNGKIKIIPPVNGKILNLLTNLIYILSLFLYFSITPASAELLTNQVQSKQAAKSSR